MGLGFWVCGYCGCIWVSWWFVVRSFWFWFWLVVFLVVLCLGLFVMLLFSVCDSGWCC